MTNEQLQETKRQLARLAMGRLYETDYHAWALEQARRLRDDEPIDAENIAEELESLGKSQQRELKNRIAEIIEHLLKLLLPDHLREPNERSWKVSVLKQRLAIEQLLEQSPSLRSLLTPKLLAECYQDGLRLFRITDTAMLGNAPEGCIFSWDEILKEELR